MKKLEEAWKSFKTLAATDSSCSAWFELRRLIRDLRPIDYLQNFDPDAPWYILQVFNGFSSKSLDWEGHLLKVTIKPSNNCDPATAIQECYLIKFSGKITCETLFNVNNYLSLFEWNLFNVNNYLSLFEWNSEKKFDSPYREDEKNRKKDILTSKKWSLDIILWTNIWFFTFLDLKPSGYRLTKTKNATQKSPTKLLH